MRIFLLLGPAAVAVAQPVVAIAGPADWVDPFMGTAGDRGQLSPAAAAPFGMVQLAPDTAPANHIGYDRTAPKLLGFSQTRAQGVGCNGGGGDLLTSAGYIDDLGPWPIDRPSERAGPGWYHVRYGRSAIIADLSAGQSVSVIRLRLPRAGQIALTLDPTHSYAKHVTHEWEARRPGDLRVRIANGTVCNKGVYHLNIAAQLTLNGRPATAATTEANGVLQFRLPVAAGDTIELRSALSTVDTASARLTLASELGALTGPQLAARSRAAWNARLSRIAFEAEPARRALFYTTLFRALQMPARVDDPVRRYRTSDGRQHIAPVGQHRYAGWSLWDNYRTQMPLLALTAPDVASDVADSLVDLFRTGKAQWAGPNEPALTVRTEYAGIALLDLHRKGLGRLDPALALDAMAAETAQLPHATPDQRLELAYDQWAVAELAAERQRPDLATEYRQRALAYRPLWLATFRDLGPDADVVKARGLYQGTLWQYRWAPVFDLAWLRDTALGPQRFADELGQFFERGLFNLTNEPDIQAPFLFTATVHPDSADTLVARFRDQPIDHWYENQRKYDRPLHQPGFALDPGFADGMDDDGGAMSAWYVWASLGLYPLVPGEPWYAVIVPAAPRASIALANGRRFTIERRGTGHRVRSIRLNGRPLPDRRLSHAALVGGGTLVVELGA